jgi:lysophospholipase L1-like esterase
MDRVRKLLDSPQPVKWVFYGDSITEGARHTFGWRGYTELFEERVRAELNRRRDVVINTAISGDNSRDLLADFNWRVGQFAPHVVFVMIGMNDASPERPVTPELFRANVTELCQRILQLPAVPVLQTTCLPQPNDTYAPRTANLLALMDVLRDIATAEKLPLIDHTQHWQAAIRENPHRAYFWMNNICHPNQFGHRAFAHEIFRALGIFEATSFACRLFVP